MEKINSARLCLICGTAISAFALMASLGSCSDPAQSRDSAQGRAYAVTVQIGQAAASQRGVVYDDGAVASVSVNVTDSDSNPVGSISLKKTADHWGGSIELTGTGIYTFAATASSSGGGKIYTGSGSQNIPTGGLSISIPVSAYTYAKGDTGPAGGLVFYDKGSYSNGWRYLEAAPSDQSDGVQWYNGTFYKVGVLDTAVGSGASNTASIVASQGAGNYAAALCADLVVGDYDDWFLPSSDELELMRMNLYQQGLGSFTSDWLFYWSSSEYGIDEYYPIGFARINGFEGGGIGADQKDRSYSVRAARSF